MEEKSYFEAMFGELSNGDGGNTFSLPNKNFISPPRLTQKNKEKLKEAYAVSSSKCNTQSLGIGVF